MPTTPPPISGQQDPNYYNGQSTGTGSGYGQNYIGSYANLPPGVTNAGGAGGNNAYTRQVQDNELVSNQLNGLLAPGSQYIDLARQSGLDTANSRGLLNSSMAAGAAQAEAIKAALPIAQGNAQAYNAAAQQNLDALNTILATRMNNQTSRANANTAAGAQRYSAQLGLQNNREQRQYSGEQAGINRNFQDYMTQMGYGQQQRMAAFQLGGNLLQNSQTFNHNLFLNAMQNPFIMQDPEALAGFGQFADQGSQSYYNDLFGYAMNGGDTLPQWQENSNWYVSPDFSQEYGDGTYVGGSPQLPYQQQPSYPYTNFYYGGGY
jgi:hypothetical protein